jgi:HK97 family phage prohead protease
MSDKRRVIDGREDRVFLVDDIELRDDASGDGDAIGVRGHAAVWDKTAWIGPPKWGFSERFQEGAFKESINGGADVRYLFNHNPDAVLARTKSGTLRLSEDKIGVAVDADLAPTSDGQKLRILLERGDVDQMSVGMQVLEDRWEEVEGKDGNLYEQRTIIRAKLFDVSAVTYPAYEETDAGLRKAEHARELRDARGVAVDRRTAPLGEAPATATPPEPAPAQGGSEVPEGPAAGGAPVIPEPATATPDKTEDRGLGLLDVLRRHADGAHAGDPRLTCPACTKPATATE